MWILLLIACSRSPDPCSAADIRYGEISVKEALDHMDARIQAQADAQPARDPVTGSTGGPSTEDRLAQLSLEVNQLEQVGTSKASVVAYNPSSTTLEAKNVQDALDELEARVARLESKSGQEMGQAGPGMFANPSGGQRGGGGGGQGGGGQGGSRPGGGGQGGGGHP